MNRLASFWSFLDDGRCRLCDREGRANPVIDIARVRGSGDALRARNQLINHLRGWHPEYVEAAEAGLLLTGERALVLAG